MPQINNRDAATFKKMKFRQDGAWHAVAVAGIAHPSLYLGDCQNRGPRYRTLIQLFSYFFCGTSKDHFCFRLQYFGLARVQVRLQNPRINQVQTKSTKLSWQRFRAHNKRWEMVRVRSKESTVSKRFLHVCLLFC